MPAYKRIIVLACSLIAAAGCQEPTAKLDPPPVYPPVRKVEPVRPTPPKHAARKPVVHPPTPKPQLVTTLPEGRSVNGRPIKAVSIGRGSQCIMIIGGIHGSEPAGVGLCEQLIAYLAAHEELLHGLNVIIVSAANPDGLAAGTRENANGVDVNRNFATGNYTASANHGGSAMSQPEAKYLRAMIDRYRPSRILTVHQPLTCIDYDGPGLALATAISRASGLPVKKLGARAGSLGSYAGVENNIPTITIELPKNATDLTASQVWARYGSGMLAGINYRNGGEMLGK